MTSDAPLHRGGGGVLQVLFEHFFTLLNSDKSDESNKSDKSDTVTTVTKVTQ